MEKKVSFLSFLPFHSHLNISVSAHASCLSSSFHFLLCRPGSTSPMTSCRHLEWLFSPPEAIPAPGQTTPASSASPHRASAPVPHHHGGSQVNLSVVMSLCLGLGAKNIFPLISTTLPPAYTNNQEIENSSSVLFSLCGISFQATSLWSFKASKYLVC